MPKLFSSKLKCPPMGHVTRKRGEVWEVLVLYIICEQSGYVNSLTRFVSLPSSAVSLSASFWQRTSSCLRLNQVYFRPKLSESSYSIAPDMPRRAQATSISCNETRKYPAYEPIIVHFEAGYRLFFCSLKTNTPTQTSCNGILPVEHKGFSGFKW